MIVPLAERSTIGSGAAGCRFAASAGITEAAMRPLNAAAISGRNTNDVSVICTVPAKIRWGEYGDYSLFNRNTAFAVHLFDFRFTMICLN